MRIDQENHPMTENWIVISDRQELGSKWRNIVIEGPGVQKPRRKYWLAWDSEREKLRNNQCAQDVKKRNPEFFRLLRSELKATRPVYY
jgi:hypothetical protein